MNVLDNEFKLDQSPLVMMNTEEREMIELLTDNNVVTNDPVFRISLKDQSTYTNLSDAYIQIRGKIRRTTDAEFAADTNITFRKGIGSLFSRCVLRINNQIVETVLNHHDGQTVKGLLHFSEDYSRSTASNMLWYKDTGDLNVSATSQQLFLTSDVGAVGANAVNIIPNFNYNSGAVARIARTRNNLTSLNVAAGQGDGLQKEFTCMIPLNQLFGFCSVDRVIINQEVAVELTRSQGYEHLQRSGGAGDGRFEVSRLSMWTPRIRPSAELDLALKSSMSAGLASDYLFNTWNSYTSQPLVSGTNTYRVLTTSENILYAFAFVRPAGFAQNNTNIQNYKANLLTCEARLNGRVYPSRRYDSLSTDEGQSRVYQDLVNYMNRSSDLSSGIQLSYDEFKKNQFIVPFDFTSKPDNWAKSPLTLEVLAEPNSNDGDLLTVVVVSQKNVQIAYAGSQATITVQ